MTSARIYSLIGVGVALMVSAVFMDGRLTPGDFSRVGSLFVIAGFVVLVMRARTIREDGAFRAGFDLGRKVGAEEKRERVSKIRLVPDERKDAG